MLEEMQTTLQLYPQESLPETIRISAATIRGTREYQEDSMRYLGTPQGVLGVVCDGMGGKTKGGLASACAMETLLEYYQEEPKPLKDPRRFYEQAVSLMDRKVARLKDEEGNYLDSGTTVVSVMIEENQMHFMSVGDSKIYLIRENCIYALTREHNYKLLLDESLRESAITYEEYERELAKGDALISYLGMNGIKVMDINFQPLMLEDGDVIILCSDGLYKALTEEQIVNIVEACQEEFTETAGIIVQTILNYVPHALDNTSVLCFKYIEAKEMNRTEKGGNNNESSEM
ncbi:PP2C family protein-serine/threonine phosphatase [Bariatricus sp. SGI.154]|uniref:PP2C family protein-serine/threonine phosphatase n=1 Tax=Bariatricus sp. SGI.154 TaxID=3420549 RepID=UPI003CFFA3C9